MAGKSGRKRTQAKGANGIAGDGATEAARGVTAIEDLAPAPYNARQIAPEAQAALRRSLSEFGDISGIVWNKRTGHLVAGHQRLNALKREHGDGLAMDEQGDAVVTPAGERFSVRVVDWDNAKEKATNIAANSPFLAGEFIPDDLESMMRELRADTSNTLRASWTIAPSWGKDGRQVR